MQQGSYSSGEDKYARLHSAYRAICLSSGSILKRARIGGCKNKETQTHVDGRAPLKLAANSLLC